MTQLVDTLTSKQVRDVIDQIAPTFKNVPHLPKGFVEFLANIAPWLAVLGGVFGALGGLGLILNGLGVYSAAWMALIGVNSMYFLVVGIIQLLAAGVALLAFKPLKERSVTGWILMFWNIVFSIAQNLVAVVFGLGFGTLIGTVIGVAIGLYILFEMRPEYS